MQLRFNSLKYRKIPDSVLMSTFVKDLTQCYIVVLLCHFIVVDTVHVSVCNWLSFEFCFCILTFLMRHLFGRFCRLWESYSIGSKTLWSSCVINTAFNTNHVFKTLSRSFFCSSDWLKTTFRIVGHSRSITWCLRWRKALPPQAYLLCPPHWWRTRPHRPSEYCSLTMF